MFNYSSYSSYVILLVILCCYAIFCKVYAHLHLTKDFKSISHTLTYNFMLSFNEVVTMV